MPSVYPYRGSRFAQEIARKLIPEVLSAGEMERREIVQATLALHVRRGGMAGAHNPEGIVRKALADLRRDNRVKRSFYGHYRLTKKPAR